MTNEQVAALLASILSDIEHDSGSLIDNCAMMMIVAETVVNPKHGYTADMFPTPRDYLRHKGHDVPETITGAGLLELVSRVTADTARELRAGYEQACKDRGRVP